MHYKINITNLGFQRIPSLVAPIDEMFVGLEEIPPSHLKTSALKTELLQHGKMPNISQKPSEFSDSVSSFYVDLILLS